MILSTLNIGLFFRKYWKAMVILIAVTFMYLYWSDRTNTISNQYQQIINLKTELQVRDSEYEANKIKYETAINDQNRKIEEANNNYEKLQHTAELLVADETARNEERVRRLEEQINLLRSIPTPKTCEESIELLINVGVANKWPAIQP